MAKGRVMYLPRIISCCPGGDGGFEKAGSVDGLIVCSSFGF